jgi:hypothetical protein
MPPQVQREQVPFLDSAENFDALSVNDVLEPPPLSGLDVNVRVNEAARAEFCQKHADRALAYTRHAYEDYILFVGRGGHLGSIRFKQDIENVILHGFSIAFNECRLRRVKEVEIES